MPEIKHSSKGGEKSARINSQLKGVGEGLRGWRWGRGLSSAVGKAG